MPDSLLPPASQWVLSTPTGTSSQTPHTPVMRSFWPSTIAASIKCATSQRLKVAKNPQSEQRKLRALSLSLNILSLQHLKKKTKRYQSLLGASLCLMAGFSVRRQTLLLGENAQRLHMSGTRIKASRLLISRLAQGTTTALNTVIKEKRRIIFFLLLRVHQISQTIRKGSTASTVKES